YVGHGGGACFLVRCEETTWGACRPECCQEEGPPDACMTPCSRAAPCRGQVCVPRTSPCHCWQNTTWPALSPALPPGQCPARAGPQRTSWAARHHSPVPAAWPCAGRGHVRHARGWAQSRFLAVCGQGPCNDLPLLLLGLIPYIVCGIGLLNA